MGMGMVQWALQMVLFLVGYFVGAYTIIQGTICLRMGIGYTNKLYQHGLISEEGRQAIKRSHIKTAVLVFAILAALIAVIAIVQHFLLIGFLGGLAICTGFGIARTGHNPINIEDYNKRSAEYLRPYCADCFVLLNYEGVCPKCGINPDVEETEEAAAEEGSSEDAKQLPVYDEDEHPWDRKK